MRRLFAVKTGLFAVLGAAAIAVSPAAAQAAPAAHAVITHAQVVNGPGGGSGLTTSFIGLTYPDTSAGLTACAVQGTYLVDDPGSHTVSWQCLLNNPNAGVYNLWTTWYPNGGGGCKTCVRKP
jgi:hypothetical protein